MRATIAFSIDERPLSLRPPRQFDYIGRMVSAAIHEPLLRADSGRIRLGAAASWEERAGGRELIFSLDPRKRWSDGRSVLAADFADALARAARHPYWAAWLDGLSRAEADGPTLRLSFRRRLEHMPALLTTINFAPRRRSAFNGPYCMTRVDEGLEYTLSPNPYYPGAHRRPNLKFIVRRGVPHARQLLDGVQVSCGTAFPFGARQELRRDGRLETRRSGVHMQLELDGEAVPPVLRRALARAIDRRAIAAAMDGGVIPATRYGSDCFPSHRRVPDFDLAAARRLLRGAESPARPLRISFNDYYPNAEVVELVRAQWLRHLGLRSRAVRASFTGRGARRADATLALRFPPFPHPSCAAEHERAATRDLVIPLFHVPNHYVKDPRVTGFRYPTDANFDFSGLRWLES